MPLVLPTTAAPSTTAALGASSAPAQAVVPGASADATGYCCCCCSCIGEEFHKHRRHEKRMSATVSGFRTKLGMRSLPHVSRRPGARSIASSLRRRVCQGRGRIDEDDNTSSSTGLQFSARTPHFLQSTCAPRRLFCESSSVLLHHRARPQRSPLTRIFVIVTQHGYHI